MMQVVPPSDAHMALVWIVMTGMRAPVEPFAPMHDEKFQFVWCEMDLLYNAAM